MRAGWTDHADRVFAVLVQITGVALIFIGLFMGAVADEYQRACFDILAGVVSLYMGGWRPEVKQ